MKTKIWIIVFFCISASLQVAGQVSGLPQGHPRFLTDAGGKEETLRLIEEETWAREVFDGLKRRTDTYAGREEGWLTSRLQMYWNTHATDVYIKGEVYDHAGGNRAPAPTVMFTGARSHATNYRRPKLEELEPYAEDPKGIYLANATLEGNPKEWVHIGKTGRMIESINREIMGIARDAAFLWWLTGEEPYGRMAASVFDTYMTGIYYRNVPVDLNNGHQQTLVGMTSFEVIHEDILNELVPLYDFLYDYLKQTRPEKMSVYAGAFKKWIENIIANGVPHNNWNLIQARYIMNVALILEDDAAYPDRKGRGYYIDYVINQSSLRQWSLKQLADYGFDSATGIWAECPGYSMNVVGDYVSFANLFDRNLQTDLTMQIPVIPKAVEALPQYLFPNRMLCGWGDTHPGALRTDVFRYLIQNAQQYGKKAEERKFTAMFRLFDTKAGEAGKSARMPVEVTSFFADKPLVLDKEVKAGKIDDYVTPTFYAPNVSWLVQRNGMDARNSLMASLNGSEGNHAHANGISLELYGKGYVLGPDAGIGKTLYQGLDYLEYYSQFPAHNTVCVDGISSYPVMKSNHAFRVRNLYPASGARVGYQPVSYTNVYFREPESYADQTRLVSIVNTGDSTGYYVDVFRSRKIEGGDKMHDYFYHNLGQTLDLRASGGDTLAMQPTQELAFAGAHLYAYSYIYNQRCIETNQDVRADFTVRMPDGDDITMSMWMKGEQERKIFSALSPMTEGLSRIKQMPYVIADQPTLTFVARQRGEAWTRPFVSVFEPHTAKNAPSRIREVRFPEVSATGEGSHTGIQVIQTEGTADWILSSDKAEVRCTTEGISAQAVYALYRQKGGQGEMAFLGGGTLLEAGDIRIEAAETADVLLVKEAGGWMYTASCPCTIALGGKTFSLPSVQTKTPVLFSK